MSDDTPWDRMLRHHEDPEVGPLVTAGWDSECDRCFGDVTGGFDRICHLQGTGWVCEDCRDEVLAGDDG